MKKKTVSKRLSFFLIRNAGMKIWPGKNRSRADAYGATRRGRTRQAAKGCAEVQITGEAQISEWGNPSTEGYLPWHLNKIG